MSSRYLSLDVLRGLAVFFAMMQHFGYAKTVWYVSYTRPVHATDPLYAPHFPFYAKGSFLPLDASGALIMTVLAPWLGHLYLFLACFNLARRSQNELILKKKKLLGLYLSLFVFFAAEKLIVGEAFVEGLSIYPLQMWMLIMAIFVLVVSKWDWRCIWFLFAAHCLLLLAFGFRLGDGLESLVNETLFRAWEYDARVSYFLGSGCLGALLGRWFWTRADRKKNLWLLCGSCFVFVGLFLWLPWPQFDSSQFFSIEHQLARRGLFGQLLIWSICVFVTLVALLAEGQLRAWNDTRSFLRFVSMPWIWIGANSLFVFALHRIIYIHGLAPLEEFVVARLGSALSHNIVTLLAHTVTCVGLVYLMKRLRWLDPLFSQTSLKKKNSGA